MKAQNAAMQAARSPRGTVLIITLWIILALAALVLVLAGAMRVELQCSANGVSAAQAQAVEQGAIQYMISRVAGLDGQLPDANSDANCQAIRVGGGAFWILKYDSDGQTYDYGITDEASKLNLNSAPASMLALLPNMTDELAASIVDWRSSGDTPSPGGAKSEYYMLLPDPYMCKESHMETVEEMMLIKDMTPDVAFGGDTNRNSILDTYETDTAAWLDANIDPTYNQYRGPYFFSTVYSADPNTSTGQSVVDLNSATSTALTNALRQGLSADRLAIIVGRIPGNRPYRNVIDFYFRSGLTYSEFGQIADRVTVRQSGAAVAKVNVNTAPPEVLACLPQLIDTDITALMNYRSDPSNDLDSIAWVTQALTRAKAIAIGGFITTRAYQFSADIVALAGDGRAFRRCRVVVDASNDPPRVVYWQDLTGLGWPLAPAIIDRLRGPADGPGPPADGFRAALTAAVDANNFPAECAEGAVMGNKSIIVIGISSGRCFVGQADEGRTGILLRHCAELAAPLTNNEEWVALGERIRQHIKAERISGRRCIIGLDTGWLVARTKSLPPAAAASLRSMLVLEIERDYPTSAEGFVFDYIEPPSTTQETSTVMLGAACQACDGASALAAAAGLTVGLPDLLASLLGWRHAGLFQRQSLALPAR